MRSLIVLVALVATAAAAGLTSQRLLQKEWTSFKSQYQKTYNSPEEEAIRMQIYHENAIRVEEHNALYAQGKVSYDVALNHLSDKLTHEVVDELAGLNMRFMRSGDYADNTSTVDGEGWSSIDWRHLGMVTPVKDQGGCGSCWIFSAIAAVESQMYKKTQKLVSLSEQNVLDCYAGPDSNGCQGGFPTDVYRYIEQNRGIDTEESYPYHAKEGVCDYNPANSGATVKSFMSVPRGENSLARAVGRVGPISATIEVSWGFHHYRSGILYDPTCRGTNNHALLVVGYDTDGPGQDYWIAKNSWGEGWGEKGYVRTARSRNNNCGIANDPTYPIV